MKRECRQHGMVRTYRILPSPFPRQPESRFINKFDPPPTAGLFTKVQSKPTNHSKFTGKCGRFRCSGCHLHPAGKSKDKGKGTQKLKANDVVANCKLITWRVVDGRPGLNFGGISASGILDYRASKDYLDDEENDDVYEGLNGFGDEGLIESSGCLEAEKEIELNGFGGDGLIESSGCLEEEKEIESTGVDEINGDDDDDDDDDDDMSFCEVGFVCDQVDGDEGWCLVGEM